MRRDSPQGIPRKNPFLTACTNVWFQVKEVMAAAEQTMQSQLAGPTIALLDDMPSDLWTRLSTRLSTSTAAAAQVT